MFDEIGAAATDAVRDRAESLDRTQPGWWWTANAGDLSGDGGSLYAVAVQGRWGLEIARRRALERKLADLDRPGVHKAMPED